MSVSSHLTPDPERRLRIIHDGISYSLRQTDLKLGAASLLAVLQAVALRLLAPDGTAAWTALLLFCAVLPVCFAGASPFIETPRPVPLLDRHGNRRVPDSQLTERDIAASSQLELTNFLDRYLGGGITATPYYEDIVARIVMDARVASRKRRLLNAACSLSVAAQLCLLTRLALG